MRRDYFEVPELPLELPLPLVPPAPLLSVPELPVPELEPLEPPAALDPALLPVPPAPAGPPLWEEPDCPVLGVF